MGIKILLADDSLTAQNMGKKILTEAGYEVVTVSNGAAAAKKIAEIKPELVLLDVFMPGYSGLELCEKLRKATETAKLPVLLTVGKMEPYSPQDGARVKADGVIVKPFEASDLMAAVERLSQKAKPAQPEIIPPPLKTPPPPPAEFKDESYLAWKQETPTESAESETSASKPTGEYQHTMRLDPAQIAAMLKVASPGATESAPPPSPAAEEFNVAAPAHAAEEFSVAPPPEPANANIPAFGLDVAETAAEVPSYMAQYLAEPEASKPGPVSTTDETVAFPRAAFEAAIAPPPAIEPVAAAPEPAVIDDMAETVVLSKTALHQFLTPSAPETPVAPAEGLELTAAAPAPDAPVAHEVGLEPTMQISDAPTMMMKDPALETDPHRASMDFVTQFGAAEPGLTDELLKSMGSGSVEPGEPVKLDDFESRVNAAMTSFSESSPDLPTLMQAVSHEPEFALPEPTLSSAFESTSVHEALSAEASELASAAAEIFGTPAQPELASGREVRAEETHEARIESISAVEASLPTSDETEASPSPVEASLREPEFAPVSLEPAAAEAQPEEAHVVNAISETVLSAPEPESASISMEAVSGPETDESVIQQMREAFSDLPVDHSPAAEAEVPAPMAMAAAAAMAPAPVPPSQIGHEAEMEIARALNAAVGGETSPAGATMQASSEPAASGDANNMAAAVEKVMQRELPSLIWKIMAELDLRKRG